MEMVGWVGRTVVDEEEGRSSGGTTHEVETRRLGWGKSSAALVKSLVKHMSFISSAVKYNHVQQS